MLLAIDCGNTHICMGLFDQDKLLRSWRVSTDKNKTEDEYLVTLSLLMEEYGYSLHDVTGLILGSVVPSINIILYKLVDKYLKCPALVVNSSTPCGLEVRLDNPDELGADRIINAVAGHAKYPGNLIIVDFGTATTFDCVSADGAYLGGAICPGVEISQQALFSRAAKLANIELKRPPAVIGTNTADSLRSGLLWGYGGQVDGIVRRMKEEFDGPVTVIATGGLATFIRGFTETIDDVASQLTLDGLRMIWDLNKDSIKC